MFDVRGTERELTLEQAREILVEATSPRRIELDQFHSDLFDELRELERDERSTEQPGDQERELERERFRSETETEDPD